MEFQYLNTREYMPAQSDRHTSIIISNICTVPTAELMAMNSQENGLQASFPNNVHFIREFWISWDFQVCLKLRLMLLCLLNSSHRVQWNVLSCGLWRCVEWSESTGVSEEHNAELILPLPFAAFWSCIVLDPQNRGCMCLRNVSFLSPDSKALYVAQLAYRDILAWSRFTDFQHFAKYGDLGSSERPVLTICWLNYCCFDVETSIANISYCIHIYTIQYSELHYYFLLHAFVAIPFYYLYNHI
jgi:hypothetical protein